MEPLTFAVDDIDKLFGHGDLGNAGWPEPTSGGGGTAPEPTPEGLSWAEMLESNHPGIQKTVEVVESTKQLLEQMFQQAAEEKGQEGVKNLLFTLGLAAENLAVDFRADVFVEVPAVREEDVFRLQRVVREANKGVGQ